MKQILTILLALFIMMQFIVMDRPNYPVDSKVALQPPKDVEVILKKACYDCHSSHTSYPWYSKVAPLSWTIRDHVKQGRLALNFSKYNLIPKDKLSHKLDRCIKTINIGMMPIPSYTWLHKDAKLSIEEKKKLIEYFESLKQNL